MTLPRLELPRVELGRLSLALTPSTGVPWMPTKKALAAFFAANPSIDTPHSLAEMSSPPTVSAIASSTPPSGITLAYRYSTSLSTYWTVAGGKPYTYATVYSQFPVATKGSSTGNVGTTELGVAWRVGIRAISSKISFRVNGSSLAAWRFIVDGQYVSKTGVATATNTGTQFLTLDFGSRATRDIWIESEQGLTLDGVYLEPGDTIAKITGLVTDIALFLGDSFTQATGAGAGNDCYAIVAGEFMGLANPWASGVGTTGYVVKPGVLYNLQDRIVADVQRAKDMGNVSVVVVAMGINDLGSAGIQAAAEYCFGVIRSMLPQALVFVLGPWDANAPSAPSVNYPTGKAAIQAAVASRGGFWFLDPQGLAYSHSDSTHPDKAGHYALGQWVNDQIRAAIA